MQSKKMSRTKVEAFYATLAGLHAEPRTELEYVNAYTLLVAVVLSAQSTDVGVNKATRGLFAEADTPEKMLALGEERVREHVRTIGLFNTKAKNVIALSQLLVERHGGAVPADREALEALPGVGRKTANVVLNEAFGHETCAVDTHIFRVANRTGLGPGRTPLAVELAVMAATPKRFRRHAHHWLILHGRYVCVARKPKCGECPVYASCNWPEKPKGNSVAVQTADDIPVQQ
ncbi:endonuclease-3 [Polymorphobacter multimanifer]|uniref:Endonuclease III n=2 Tax=Polymorphobacter multimanifer TaxID=1070431 RepID=A0A841LHM6_9SPHN|nr:endonuclease-3 [Polymorphobacter multimanifer]